MTDHGALLRELAVPRLAGTVNNARVRERLTRELTARGFAVEAQPFVGAPSRLLLGAPRRVEGVNLVARRPGGGGGPAPTVWLTAHYDSKGQPISMATRLGGAAALVLGAVAVLAHPLAGAAVAALGAAVLARNRVTDGSPGAVDNASGVLTVLEVLDRLPAAARVGVVFPDAEEYALVGARALAAGAPGLFREAAVINFDGIDDRGRPIAFVHRPGPVAARVAAALGAARRVWLPVVVDGMALAGVARECVTILKGDWGTARVVHTAADRAERLTLAGVREVAAGVARALAAL